MLLLTVILMDMLAGMEFDLFIPSFPQLQNDFSLTPFWVEALLSVNFIAYCVSLFFVGILADRYGRRLVIVSGLVLFVLGSVLCLVANAYPVILLGRLLQGLGVAAPATLSFVIIADLYSLKQQQFLMGILNGVMNLAVAIAPVLGSYLTFYFHWQGNFAALLVLGLVALMMTFKYVPKTAPKHDDECAHGYLILLRSRPLLLLMLSFVMMCLPYWIFVGVSPLLYIKDLGVSLKYFGYYQGVLAFVFALGSVALGLLVKNRELNEQRLLYITNFIFIVSFLGIFWITIINSTSALLITLMMLIFVIGQIIPSIVLYPKCLNLMPKAKGRISALIQALRLVFTAVSLEVAGYFYAGSFQNVGIVISVFVLLTIVCLFRVLKNQY